MTRRHYRMLLVLCGAACALAVKGCGDPPTGLPEPFTGSLTVTAMDTLVFDSIFVALDDIPQGKLPNPCTLHGVVAGMHKLTVTDSSGARSDTMVTVRRNEVAALLMRLTKIGPFLGNEAPDFTVRTIDDSLFDMHKQRGKVVLLVFFEHT